MKKKNLVFGKASADGSGFLGAEIEGQELLLLVCLPKGRFLFLRYHR